MDRWGPARLAKLGLVIFAPVEITRLVSGGTFLGSCTVVVTWLGQGLILVAAMWAAFVWTDRPRLVRALLGLLFLMIPVWPWFNLYLWDAGGMTSTSLLEGIDPQPFLQALSDDLVAVEYLHLIEGPVAIFPSSLSGCVVAQEQGAPTAIVSLIGEGTQQLILAAVVVGMAISVAGAAVAAWNLWGLAHTLLDRLWVVAAIATALVIGALLVAQASASVFSGGCTPPSPEHSAYRLHLWLGVRLHPFGPAMLVIASALLWFWPRRIAEYGHRVAQARQLFKPGMD